MSSMKGMSRRFVRPMARSSTSECEVWGGIASILPAFNNTDQPELIRTRRGMLFPGEPVEPGAAGQRVRDSEKPADNRGRIGEVSPRNGRSQIASGLQRQANSVN